ncbi:MAG: ABC transporter permease [Ruminococcaceae bacterium]|nr:ABC transporter permease [Oscillospiraceae bacterium]
MTDTKLKQNHEPLIHITKRDDSGFWKSALVHLIGIVIALMLSSLLIIAVTGQNPMALFKSMYEGVIGTPIANSGINKKYVESLHIVAILLCISLAVTPAFKMKFWNIGAEGQVLMGCLASAYCMIEFGGKMDNTVLLLVMLAASILVGAIWAVIPAICKAFWNTNETLFTLMMNYVAMTLVSYFIMVKDKSGRSDLGIINERTGYGYLPNLFERNYIFNIIIVAAVTVLMFIYLKYSKQGYEISVVGESENTARYIGINVKKVIIRTVAISGAICGLVGFMIIAGDKHSIKDDIVGGQGFTAIMVSWMAGFNPIVMIPVSMLIVFLSVGSKFATSAFKLDNSIGDILTAIVIFSIIACEFFIRYKVNFRKSVKGDKS